MSLPELIEVVEVGNTLGEGVIWNATEQSVWWTDIESSELFRYQLATKKLTRWQTPERLCSFGFVEGSEDLIAAFESGFAFYQPSTGKLQWLHKVTAEHPGVRMNDGRVDRQGRFWAGSMIEGEDAEPGRDQDAALYCLDQQGRCSTHQSGVQISNSLCWSPDARMMYFADSPKRQLYRYHFDPDSGTASHQTIFAETPEDIYPDGSSVDAQGFLWNAQWGGSRVVRYDAEGQARECLSVPVTQPSCVAFGGSDLNLLFVTSAKQGMSADELSADPLAGHLLIYQTSVEGLPESLYRRQRALTEKSL